MTTFLPVRYRILLLATLLALLLVPLGVSAETDVGHDDASHSAEGWIVQLESGWMQFSSTDGLAGVLGDATRITTGTDGSTVLATFDGETTAASAIVRLYNHPGVAYVEPDIIYEYQYEFVPNDEIFDQQEWAQTVNLPAAWSVSTGNPDVIVAVVDSGVRPDHPDLEGKLVEGYNWVGLGTDSHDPTDTIDTLGHGTAVAGIIGAIGDNETGIAGTSMNVQLMPLRVGEANGAPVGRIALAVEHAVDNGAKVINLSLGSETESARLNQALRYADAHDVIVVAAGGNTWDQVSFPGSSPTTISVGATTLDGSDMAPFSSRLSTIDLVAPGINVLTTYWTPVLGNHYAGVRGTSFSTPIVTGTAALIHSVNPDLDVHQVRTLLQETAQMHFAEGTTGTGSGLLDANAAVREAMLPTFGETWLTADEPVASRAAVRSWLWGPHAFDLRTEPYADAENGFRLVAYFDKSRMEVTDIYGDRASEWYVTNGLLVNELISGQMQVGDTQFETRAPAEIPIAGDPEENAGPTYASFNGLTAPEGVNGTGPITQTLDRDGSTGVDPEMSEYGVLASEFIPETGFTIADVFWEYLTSAGVLRVPGANVEGPIFNPTFFATGFPVTDAYWSSVTVDGIERDVLLQCFERRCLTYTPSNESGWQVEMGNVGQHYYRWRYEMAPGGPVAQDPAAYAINHLR